ncbi:unnamed protein product [Thlaspi arvense]|uniref:Uncharacterized protein n=1 Tax=Thlaspi arvense TaxID=13288 RepID=A0AAU9RSC2_THLAR|nr:unnamed protein product [Thlaspi arvense]
MSVWVSWSTLLLDNRMCSNVHASTLWLHVLETLIRGD